MGIGIPNAIAYHKGTHKKYPQSDYRQRRIHTLLAEMRPYKGWGVGIVGYDSFPQTFNPALVVSWHGTLLCFPNTNPRPPSVCALASHHMESPQ